MIDLSPHEWATATWRPLPDVSGPAREFDPNVASELIKRDVHILRNYLGWEWAREPFADPIGLEEATAWLRVADGRHFGDTTAATLHYRLSPAADRRRGPAVLRGRVAPAGCSSWRRC